MKLKCQNSDLEENKLDWASTCKMKKMEIFCFFILSITNGILRIFYGVTILCTSCFANMLQLKESQSDGYYRLKAVFVASFCGKRTPNIQALVWLLMNCLADPILMWLSNRYIQSLCRILVSLLNISRTILQILDLKWLLTVEDGSRSFTEMVSLNRRCNSRSMLGKRNHIVGKFLFICCNKYQFYYILLHFFGWFFCCQLP